MHNTILSSEQKKKAGLLSALSLLAGTAPAEVVRFFPDPITSTEWTNAPLLSWNPTALEAQAGDGDDLYPGGYSGTIYGCMGYIELSAGTPEGLQYLLSAEYTAPALSLNDTIGSSHSLWSGSDAGWQASIDLSGVSWGQPFYIGYRLLSGSDYLYGYARLSASFNEGNNLTQLTASEWAYESTPNTDITIAAIPEPGVLVLLLIGFIGLTLRRFFNPRR